MTQFVSPRIFTEDVDALIEFYESITGIAAQRLHPLFGELATDLGTVAIASVKTVGIIGAGSAEAAANRSVSLDFLVDDVDALLPRLREIVKEFVSGPTDLPWGNRSVLFRDPDGNLVNFFTPTTPEARKRFGLS
jgi:predicted enzyme related to lactoylglutathione lyase